MPTRLLQTRSYDEKCQFGLTFFLEKELNRVGIFLVMWPHRFFFSIQSVITKVEIIPFFMGILFICLNLFLLTKGKE